MLSVHVISPNPYIVVSYKKRNSGKLLNIFTATLDPIEASRQAGKYIQQHYPGSQYKEYGISKSPGVNING